MFWIKFIMENCAFHLLCSFDAKISFLQNGKEIFSVLTLNSLSDQIDLSVSSPQNFTACVYPVGKNGKNFLSYSVEFSFNKETFVSSSKQALVYKLPQENFIFQFKPAKLTTDELFACDKVEVEGNKIKVLKILNNISKRGIVKEFEIVGDKPEKCDEYLINMGDGKFATEEAKILDFFENVCAGDYNSAVKNLSYSLSEKLNKQTIKNFVGEFNTCFLVNFYEKPCVVCLNEKNSFAIVFSASFENGMIYNIFEI